MKCESCGYVKWDWRNQPLCPEKTKMVKMKDIKCATCGYVDINAYYMMNTAKAWMEARKKREEQKIKDI